MLCHAGLAIFLAFVGMTHGNLREVTVSSANFASMAVELVSQEYEKMLKEGKQLEPATKVCHEKFKSKNDSCQSCIKGITSCGNLSPLQLLLGSIKDPSMLMTLAQIGIDKLGSLIANGATTLYEKYGQGPVNELKKGFNHIGEGFDWIGDKFKIGFGKAFNGLKTAFNVVTNWSKDAWGWLSDFGKKGWAYIPFNFLTGRRRKRYDQDLDDAIDMLEAREKRGDVGDFDVEEALREYASREKRAEDTTMTPEQRACIKGKCPVCGPFLNATIPGADLIDIWREICGADIIDKNLELEKRIEQVKKFYKVLTSTTKDVLKTLVVNTATGKVSKIVALVGKTFVTYHPTGIPFDPWHQDPAYRAIARFLLGKH